MAFDFDQEFLDNNNLTRHVLVSNSSGSAKEFDISLLQDAFDHGSGHRVKVKVEHSI